MSSLEECPLYRGTDDPEQNQVPPGCTSCVVPTSRFLEKAPLGGHTDVNIVAYGYAFIQMFSIHMFT
jgi:hypothetical protein